MASREERIREMAHQIWEKNGRPEGQADAHWDEAAKKVDEEDSIASQAPKNPGRESRNRA